MFRLLAQFARLRRPDASLFFVAALLALWAMPVAQWATAPGTPSVESVLLLLSAEASAPQTAHLGSPTVAETPPTTSPSPLWVSTATAHLGAFSDSPSPPTPQIIRARRTHELSATVIARLSGVQTQVRLN